MPDRYNKNDSRFLPDNCQDRNIAQQFMNIIEPIIWGLILSADSFSAAIALGFRPHKFNDSLKFGLASGGAEAIATFIGAMAGVEILSRFSPIDQWIAFFLLFAVAIHMFYEGVQELRQNKKYQGNVKFHSFTKIILVSIATSIDALAVGVSLGVSHKPLTVYILAIGAGAFLSTLVGMAIAKKAPKKLSGFFNILGAIILFVLSLGIIQLIAVDGF